MQQTDTVQPVAIVTTAEQFPARRQVPETAADLAARFTSEGFAPGTPPGFPAAALAADRFVYRGMKCPACKRRGMEFRPHHKGRRYRVLLACTHCPGGCEA